MRLFTYIVARDYGFAPNPFGGVCTLATCKPKIRRTASVGDWIAGIASKKYCRVPSLLYMMRVDEVSTYNEYWKDSRFQKKKPSRTSSVKQLFGDNIYHRNAKGQWIQADSHHSLEDGTPNLRNIDNDTQSEGVLIGWRYAYWGSNAIKIPGEFLDYDGDAISLNRGYKYHYSDRFVNAFVQWFESLKAQGHFAPPVLWQTRGATWSKPSI